MVEYKYDAWGNCKVLGANGVEITDTNHIGILNPFKYRSYYFDTETGLYFLKSRYYDPAIGRFISIDDHAYLDPDTVNGLNLYAYCLNNPLAYLDPTGTSLIVGLLIFIGCMIAVCGTLGGLSAGMSGGSIAEVFAGIGKGMVVGAFLGLSIALIIGGVASGALTGIGSLMTPLGISFTSNYIEVAVTQGKKSYSEGLGFWDGANNITNAMFSNSPQILIGKTSIGSEEIWGIDWILQTSTISDILSETYIFWQSFSLKKAFTVALNELFCQKSFFNLTAYIGSAQSVYEMLKAIFTEPDFQNSNWILY